MPYKPSPTVEGKAAPSTRVDLTSVTRRMTPEKQPSMSAEAQGIPHLDALVETLTNRVVLSLAEPEPYDNVTACFVRWADDSDDSPPKYATAELQRLVSKQFGYDVREVRLPSPGGVPRDEFAGQVSAFVRQLFILHYDGPSGYRRRDGRGIWSASPERQSFGVLEWEDVTRCVREAAVECDVLFILDCDFGSSVVRPDSGAWSQRCEVLCATPPPATAGSSTPSASVTTTLTSVLGRYVNNPRSSMQLSWLMTREASCENTRWLRHSTPSSETLHSSILLHPLGKTNAQSLLPRAAALSYGTQIEDFQKIVSTRALVGVTFTEPQAVVNQLQTWLRLPLGKTGGALVSSQIASQVPSRVPSQVSSQVPSKSQKGGEPADLRESLRKLVKCHCLLSGTPAPGVLTIPIWLWDCLAPHPAFVFIGLTTQAEENLLRPLMEKTPPYTEPPTTRTSPTSPSKRMWSWSTRMSHRTNSLLQRQFAAVLADAQKRYADSTGKDLAAFSNPPIKSVEKLCEIVDAENDKFTKFRAKRRTLFSVMKDACTPLEVVGEALSGAASEVFPPAQNIFAAVMFLINAARDVSECYDSIIELFSQLKDFTARLKLYVSERMSPDLHDKVVEILTAVFQILVLATEEVERGRLKAFFKRLFGKESPVAEAVENLAKLTEAEERLVGAETNAVVKRSLSDQQRLLEIISRVDVNVQTLRAETRPQAPTLSREQLLVSNTTKLKGILRPSSYAEDAYLALDRTRTPGTGDWILEDPSLRGWLQGEFRFLWICGNPGTGKSYLTSRLVSWSLSLMESQDDEARATGVKMGSRRMMMAYFFFRQSNPETRSVTQALRDMASQLGEQDVFYGKQVLKELASSDEVKTVASAFRKLLVEPFVEDRWKRHVYLLMDGLDEADPAELGELLPLLADLRRQPADGTRVQIALVGRNSLTETVLAQLDMGASAEDAASLVRSLHVTADRNGADIVSYIVEGVSSARIMRGTSRDFKKQVVEEMTRQVDGLFVLAKFMLSELAQIRRPRQIIESLHGFPKEINGMLKKAAMSFSSTLSEEDAADLNEILRWVAVAQMGLTLEQIACVLALQEGGAPSWLEETLRVQFSCFFTLERADGLSTADLTATATAAGGGVEYLSNARTTFVTFFHESVREFFVGGESDELRAAPSSPAIGFKLADARLHVLNTCLRIFTDTEWFRLGAEEGLSLQRYAAWYWQEHLQLLDRASLSQDEKRKIGGKLHRMLNDRVVVLSWTNLFEESLDIWTDDNIDCVREWLADPDVVAGFPDEEGARAWAAEASKLAAKLVEPMGRIFAAAWLQKGFDLYMPTLFCFGVVQCVALMADDGEEGGEKGGDKGREKGGGKGGEIGGEIEGKEGVAPRWSDSEYHWEDVTLETRVAKAAQWAIGPGILNNNSAEEKPEAKGHRFRRIGSTLLSLGLHEEALKYFERAQQADGNVAENCGRMGLCKAMSGDWEESLRLHLMAQEADLAVLDKGVRDAEVAADDKLPVLRAGDGRLASWGSREGKAILWRLYKNLCQVAECHSRLGNVNQALEHAREAMDPGFADQHPIFEPEAAYVRILAENGRVDDLMELVHELDEVDVSNDGTNTTASTSFSTDLSGGGGGKGGGYSRFVAFLLDQIPDRSVRKWFPQAAARSGETFLLADRLNQAAMVARGLLDPWKERYLRNSLGKAYLCAGLLDEAIVVHEEICLAQDLHSRGGGSLAVRAEYVASFRQLARAYALQAQLLLEEGGGIGGGIGGVHVNGTAVAGGGGKGGDALRQWTGKLEKLMAQQERFRTRLDDAPLQLAGLEFNEASVFLISLYRRHQPTTTTTNGSTLKKLPENANGSAAQTASWNALTAARVRECLDLLEDDEPQNDVIAIRNLQRTLLAAGDEENARALWQSTRRPSAAATVSASRTPVPAGGSHLTSTHTPGGHRHSSSGGATPSSPKPDQLHGRQSSPGSGTPPLGRSSPSAAAGPFQPPPPLPGSSRRPNGRDLALTRVFFRGGDLLTDGSGSTPVACDACLKLLKPDEELAVCKLCIDARFCAGCLGVLKSGGASAVMVTGVTGEKRRPLGNLCCSASHEWMVVPPLDRDLKPGEILVGSGGTQRVVRLDDWKASLRLRWVGDAGNKGHHRNSSSGSLGVSGPGRGMSGLGIAVHLDD